MCANCNVFLKKKTKKYYPLANCNFFYHTHSKWSHYVQLKIHFIIGIFHVPSTLQFSHTGMASIFKYRLLFTLCATEWPCNFNFNIQLLGSFYQTLLLTFVWHLYSKIDSFLHCVQ